MTGMESAPTTTVRGTSEIARRMGPIIVIGSLVVLVALLAWLALAPTAIAGDLEDAPFTVPATLVVTPDEDGCLDVVTGDGTITTHCLEELAVGRGRGDRDVWVDVTFTTDGTLKAFKEGPDVRTVLWIDPTTGEVLDREEFEPGEEGRFHEERAPDEDPGVEPRPAFEVYPDGDLVRRFDPERGEGQGDEPIVLDLDGPPGYRLREAVVSPDGAWVVVSTPDDLVAVAPTDGSAAPYVWAEVHDDGWVNLHGGIHWED